MTGYRIYFQKGLYRFLTHLRTPNMRFSDFQKSIIKNINENKVRTLRDLIENFYAITQIKEYKGRYIAIPKDREKAEKQTVELFALLKWLEKEQLIYFLEQDHKKVERFEIHDTFDEKFVDQAPEATVIMRRVEEFQHKEIVPAIDLQTFIDNKFQTIEQHRFKRSEYRATIAIITTALLALASIVLNIWSNLRPKGQTKVVIEANNTIPDTTIVKIANQSAFPDTIKMMTIPNKSKK
jgi:hypothetical protein